MRSVSRKPAPLPGRHVYRPVLIQKGFTPGYVHPLTMSWPTPDECAPEIVEVSDEGFDLTSYRKAAQLIDAPMLLFFNSYSHVLAAGWLAKLYSAAERLGPGALVGATGSWEALGEHTAFPNVAIRTNAFLIERAHFLSFAQPLDTKRHCNLFEAGPASMTKIIRDVGGRVAIVDREGRVIEPDDWPEARVFRSGNQEQLLVADNRTMDYQCVSLRRRSVVFSQEMGETYRDYLTRVRIEHAKELLRTTNILCAEVAYQSGYNDPHYFSYIFKKNTGMSPQQFRLHPKIESNR